MDVVKHVEGRVSSFFFLVKPVIASQLLSTQGRVKVVTFPKQACEKLRDIKEGYRGFFLQRA